jgi:hypothetical protein
MQPPVRTRVFRQHRHVAWSTLFLLSFPLCAQDLPSGSTLEVRLSTSTGSRLSHEGDSVEGRTIAPVSFGGRILVPQGSEVFGVVKSVQQLGFGLKHITASIRYEFQTLRLPNGNVIPIDTQLLEVETAKERVDVEGTARGIHPAASLSSSLALFTVPLLFLAPTVGIPVLGLKLIVAPSANPEIYFPVGTELILELTRPIKVDPSMEIPMGITSFSAEELSEVQQLLDVSAQRARLGTHPSDLVNLLLLGSREDMDRAFRAAGWVQAEGKSPMSLYRMYHALTKRTGYTKAPMNALTLDGAPSDVVYQKGLNTVQKRHHLRLWKAPHMTDVWLGAAAEDIAFRFELAHWTHSTDSQIDNERAKVVNDLAFTRCLDATQLVTRHFPDLRQIRKGVQLILTDHAIAAVRLKSCDDPRTMPGVDAVLRLERRGPMLRGWRSLHNDLSLNIFFTTYNAVRLLTDRHALKPLRRTTSADSGRRGLDWLGSLPKAPNLSSRGLLLCAYADESKHLPDR